MFLVFNRYDYFCFIYYLHNDGVIAEKLCFYCVHILAVKNHSLKTGKQLILLFEVCSIV